MSDLMELEERVRTALAIAGFPSSYVSTSIDETGKVWLTGVVQDPMEKFAAEVTALEVEGVELVENQIKIVGV
jgi:osmotically-inducible protein OsmY